jgi:hypothetical protein
MSKQAADIIEGYLAELRTEHESLLAMCESPAEQNFMAAAIDYFGLRYNEHYKRGQATFDGVGPASCGLFTLLVEPQVDISSFDASYRADFVFSLTRYARNGVPRIWGKTVVEIDGHDFHEKTKSQASRDKKRDRDFLSEGYVTMRFSGSDVYHRTFECVEEVSFHLDRAANEVVKSYEERGDLLDLLI